MVNPPRVWRSQTARNRMQGVAGSCVTIVSEMPEALGGLQQYLSRVGVVTSATRAIRDLSQVAPAHATATIIFVDDFVDEAALATIDDLRRKRPEVLVVLVTGTPGNLRHLFCEADDDELPMPTVMSKPLRMGEDLLDAIRRRNASSD